MELKLIQREDFGLVERQGRGYTWVTRMINGMRHPVTALSVIAYQQALV